MDEIYIIFNLDYEIENSENENSELDEILLEFGY